ncbi:putative permease [Escherichia coli]|uniref:Putative permease n=1 Tax=Escherichia coli TaxID=562 RepID=A0A376UHN4_ECOLX|nr:putative permease [Escherichia coli]
MGLLMLVARDFSLLAEIFPMNVFSRYLIRHLFLGFAAAAGLLLPLFTTST